MDAVVIGVLTWVHVFSAMGWFGGDLTLMLGMDRKLDVLSFSTRGELITRVFPGLNRLEAIFAGTTVVFGALLAYAVTDGDFALLSPSTPFGLAVTVGGTLALVAFLLEVTVHSPSVRKVVAMVGEMRAKNQESPPPGLARYQRRAEVAEATVIVLLFVILAFMVAAGQL